EEGDADADDFSIDDDLGDFSFDDAVDETPADETPADEITADEPAAAPEEGDADADDFSIDDDLGDFSFDDTGDESFAGEVAADESADTSADAPVEGDVDQDDLGDFSFDDAGDLGASDADDAGISEAEYAGLTGSIDDSGEEPATEGEESFDDFSLPDTVEEDSGEEIEEFDISDDQFSEVGEDGAGEIEDFAADEEFTVPEEFAVAEEPADEPGEQSFEDEDTAEEFSFEEGVDEFELPDEATQAVDFEEMDLGDADTESSEAEEPDETSEVGEDDFDLDDFSLGDISEQFGVSEDDAEVLPAEEELNPALVVGDQLPGSEDRLDLSDPRFAVLQQTLAGLPRNLRLIIEEAIGEEQLSGPKLESLVDALTRGRSAKEIAALTGKITGKRIEIPSQYEKRTGLEFEEEKGTFAYIFKHSVLPVLRTVLIVIVGVGLISLLGYRYLFRPIRAAVYYNRGLEQIDDGSHRTGNDLFDQGRESWEVKKRYYQYAEAFIDQRRDDLAAEKYEQLLLNYRDDRKGLLDYARLETYRRASYEHAEELLDVLLSESDTMYDYDALIQSGDNYMEWALEDSSKYENARFAYASLIQEYGDLDDVMFRMLKYFIRTDNLPETLRLKDYFQSIEKLKLDTDTYAELGGYLVTQDERSGRSIFAPEAREILFRTMAQDENLPEVHYHLSRLFRSTSDYDEERKALAKAYEAFRLLPARNSIRETNFIDTINRQGEAAFREREYLLAEDKYLAAKKRFETAESIGSLQPSPVFGRIYSNLGDIYYYVSGNYPSAMKNFQSAKDMNFAPPVLDYKMGYINYRNEQYDEALLKFFEAAGAYSSNVNLMFTTANSLYSQGLYSSAQGYYLHVLTSLESTLRNIAELRPDEQPEHRALLVNLMRAYNNLGATLFQLSERSGDTGKVTQALVNLTTSSEYFDQITRDRNTLVRTESKNLSFLNTRAIIYPEPGFEVEIYNEIPRDFTEVEF
ncbi:MAG: hypothetical protein HN368_19575, partial [Spirochaetales bacterium]|nr:hypothetical protein [Spirochaetales bacterium]